MKRPTVVALSVALLMMASATWTQAETDKPAVTQTMNDYFASFADLGPTFDMRRALSFFHEPSMLITASRATSYPTRGDVEAGWVNGFVARQRERGYARQDVSRIHVKQMSNSVALASVEIVRYQGRWRSVGAHWRKLCTAPDGRGMEDCRGHYSRAEQRIAA